MMVIVKSMTISITKLARPASPDAQILQRRVHRHVGSVQHGLFGDDLDYLVFDGLAHARGLSGNCLCLLPVI